MDPIPDEMNNIKKETGKICKYKDQEIEVVIMGSLKKQSTVSVGNSRYQCKSSENRKIALFGSTQILRKEGRNYLPLLN